ncbi:MAG: preprotein translocase subunit SecG [Candidatus Fournierella pullistercoris]|uniref:Protein-export membrane protein SecG n=1 Tax=Candidatus Allofournierella pullistercoris TaxID=2838597 RepID=A0A948T1H5_9FIRM|nr:preprotein translocase subunit SecG [Candidatus Fournierella pullistercoris]
MSIIEIISGVVLILAAIAIILLTLAQESKGRGLSGAIMGEGGMMEAGRTRGRDVKLAQATRVVSIVFFLVVIAVSILSVIGMN